METTVIKLLEKITGKLKKMNTDAPFKGAYNIRKDGKSIGRSSSANIIIQSKKDKDGLDIYIKENTKGKSVHIPVLLMQGGYTETVYNDFYIGKNAQVDIIAGCGINNCACTETSHDGVHRFFVEEGAKVTYTEKHYGEGEGSGKRIMNPITEVELKKNASLTMNSVQIKGVDSTYRITRGSLSENSTFTVSEKIMTAGEQTAQTEFEVNLNGKDSSTHLISRSIASGNSEQKFISRINGNTKCYAHVECDAIIMDDAKVAAVPAISANDTEANLIHEAAIGKIAGEQLMKLMTLGLTEKEAETAIIDGFLK